jgi:tetratricopeptide (TPR) repeat protein
VRILRLVAGLVCIATAARAQIATQQPSIKLLVLPLTVKTPADSGFSIAVMDVAREKLGSMARYRVQVIPKAKLCEALAASDYACNVLLDETQANQLARFLNVNAYTTGTLQRSGNTIGATIRVRDIGSSGLDALFSVSSGNPGTAAAAGELIAQRVNTIIRAGEQARDCNEQRSKSQFGRALDAARKALAIEPNLPAAHICTATVYEAQHMGVDSQLVAYQRASKGDSLNATAWENIAHLYQQKGDTLKAIDALIHELAGEPQNAQLRLGIAELLRQQKQYARAKGVLDEWLAKNPGDQRVVEFRQRICIEGELWRCALDGFVTTVQNDSGKGADSAFVKGALGAAQQVADTQQQLVFSRIGVKHFPKSAVFWKSFGSAFDMKGQKDSSLWAYKQSLAIDPSDVQSALLVAKALVDGATFDTAQATKLKSDTAALHRLRTAFADQLDSARAYLERAAASPDTNVQVNAAAIMRTAGEKLVRAGAGDRSVWWLHQTLALLKPRTPADSTGVRQAIRVNTSFWFGLASMSDLPVQYQAMTKSKNCSEAKAFNDHLEEVRASLTSGRSVHPPTVDNMLQSLGKFDAAMQSVRKAFKCKNF